MLWIDSIIFEGTNTTFIDEPGIDPFNFKLSKSAIRGIIIRGVVSGGLVLLSIFALVKNKINPSPTDFIPLLTMVPIG